MISSEFWPLYNQTENPLLFLSLAQKGKLSYIGLFGQ